MHCCRLSHPWVYKVGKMSSTLNVHGGGMQRWCSSNNTDREHLNARRVRLYLWYLLISTIFSYYTLNNSPTTEFAGTFFWCHRVSATEIQGKPIYRNEKEKEWRDARMLICIFAQIVKMLLAPWHHAIWLWRINTNIKSLACVELSDLKYQGRRSFGLDIYLKKKIVPACFISGN